MKIFENFPDQKNRKFLVQKKWSAKFQNALTSRLLRLLPSDQKQKSRNCLKFADTKYLVLKVDSRGEKKGFDPSGHRIKEISTKWVEFREITLKFQSFSGPQIFHDFRVTFRVLAKYRVFGNY